MDDDGAIERALRRVIARHGPSILGDNDAVGRQLRFELGDDALDHEEPVVAMLKVLRSGALRDIEVGDLGGAYRTATAANPGIAHEAADWSVAVLDRVTAGRLPPTSVKASPRKPAPATTTVAEPTRPVAVTGPATVQMPSAVRSDRPTADMLAYDRRPAWPTRAKVLVLVLALLALGGGTAAAFLAVDGSGTGSTATPPVITPETSTTIAAPTTTVPTTTTTTTTTTTSTTSTTTTTTTTIPVVVAIDQVKASGPLGRYAFNVVTAGCTGLVGCEAFPAALTATAQDPTRVLTVEGIFAIPVSFAGGIGPWQGTGSGAGLATGVDCGNASSAVWTVTVEVTAAQLSQPPVATALNYSFRARADPTCPTQGTAEFTGTLRRIG